MTVDEQLAIVKVDMLRALARSQTAVARILEHTADSAAAYRLPLELIGEQLRALADYQRSLLAQVSGLHPRVMKRSETLSEPWLNPEVTPPIAAANLHGLDRRQTHRVEAGRLS